MLYIGLLISFFILPITTHCSLSDINLSGSVAFDFLDTETHRSHFISGSRNLDGVASFDLRSLEIYVNGALVNNSTYNTTY